MTVIEDELAAVALDLIAEFGAVGTYFRQAKGPYDAATSTMTFVPVQKQVTMASDATAKGADSSEAGRTGIARTIYIAGSELDPIEAEIHDKVDWRGHEYRVTAVTAYGDADRVAAWELSVEFLQ